VFLPYGTDQVQSFLIWYRDIGNHEVEALPLRNRSCLQAIPSRQHLMASFFQDFRQQSAHARQQEQRDRRAPTNRRRYRITGRFLERCKQLQPVGDFTSSWDGSSKTNFRVPGNPFPVQPARFQRPLNAVSGTSGKGSYLLMGALRCSSSEKFSRKITWLCICCASGVSTGINAAMCLPSGATS
jgi:hypothetical protein